MAPPLLTLKDISLTFGGRPIFDKLSLYIQDNERLCLVGRNGSGKSTLLKILADQLETDRGERVVQTGKSVVYLPQDPDMSPDETIEHYVRQGLLWDQQDDHYRVDMILEEMKLKGEITLKDLSGGERRKVALAQAFVSEPSLLLLDEPTNHLDLPAIEWLEETLKSFKGSFVTISHDRMFLSHLSRATLWLDRGQVRRHDKGFEHFDEWADVILEQEEIENQKLNKLIAEETRWSRQGISARRKRNQGRLRRLYSLRDQRSQQVKQLGTIRNLEIESGEASSRMVIEARHISKTFEDRSIVDNFSLRLVRGDRIGIIGPNGVGKTTLLKILMGDLTPDSGKIRWGMNLTPSYLDQNRAALNPQQTLWETLCDTGADQIMVRGTPKHVVGYLKDFLFEERQVRSPVHVLSGGEKNRLILAKSLAKESNFLILDEPTNDLDMETMDLLQEILDDYEGTVLLVSHDRSFLDRVVTSTLVFEGDGKITQYAGGYSDYRRLCPLSPSLDAKQPTKSSSKANSKGSKTSSPRLSYHHQRLLDVLPQEVAQLEQDKIKIEQSLADPKLFTDHPKKFSALSQRHQEIIDALDEKENQWLALIEAKESLLEF
ncbi:MAG: ABC-F family ATP-binding cassette domain-containing protein [Janthinobacterium lividum]